MTLQRSHLAERRAVVRRDLEELRVQVEEGEVREETAARLRASYEAELAELETALGDLPPDPGTPPPAPAPSPASKSDQPVPGRSPRRVAVGATILIAALSIAIWLAAQGAEPDSPASSGSPGELLVDPDSVSDEQLEAIVADNPAITGMRMALADRYFQAEEYGASLDHYLFIADNATEASDRSVALARLGWMAYITGQPQAADQYIDMSLSDDANNAEAILFRGFITLYGLGEAEAAIPQLERALELTVLSDSVIDQIDEALADAREGGP